MQPVRRHAWDLSPAAARELQAVLKACVRLEALAAPIRRVAGVDAAFRGSRVRAAIVVLELPGLTPVELSLAEVESAFPYVPGLLTFREGPAVLAAAARLAVEPDVLIFDGQGTAHPQRFGLASHLGVLLDRPTVGCAKSRLCGTHDEPGPERGAMAPLRHRGEIIGSVLRTRSGVRPVFVSPGHRIDLPQACDLVLRCCRRFRLPEPTRLAHRAAEDGRLRGFST